MITTGITKINISEFPQIYKKVYNQHKNYYLNTCEFVSIKSY